MLLAEKANQLYRDTNYRDLITFEEEIAKISSMILVVAESPGSLAELGAFSTNESISQRLYLLIQEEFEKAESFVRYGPVERIKKDDESRVAAFPWKLRKNGSLIKKSAAPHVRPITKFLKEGLAKIPKTFQLSTIEKEKDYYFVYWIILLSTAANLSRIHACVNDTIGGVDQATLKRMLYCMKLAGWVDSIRYSNVEYFFCLHDVDPLQYKFTSGVAARDSVRRKLEVSQSLQKAAAIPGHVRGIAMERRKARST